MEATVETAEAVGAPRQVADTIVEPAPAPAEPEPRSDLVAIRLRVSGDDGVVIYRRRAIRTSSRYVMKELFE